MSILPPIPDETVGDLEWRVFIIAGLHGRWWDQTAHLSSDGHDEIAEFGEEMRSICVGGQEHFLGGYHAAWSMDDPGSVG